MNGAAQTLIVIGALLLAGLLADYVGRGTRIPRVTVLMLLGLLVGPVGLDLLPEQRELWLPAAADIALVMIGFLLGSEFSPGRLRGHGREVVGIAFVQAAVTAVVVGAGLFALGAGAGVALLLAGVATATAPAATVAVVRELRAEGRFTDTLQRVVAIDDLLALVLFSFLAAAVSVLLGNGSGADLLLEAVKEIGGAVGLGAALGVPAALLSGRIQPGEATLLEALGLILLCAGLANWLGLSPLLMAVVMGSTVANLARHHTRTFHEIEDIEWPFLVLFFVLAGASLEVGALTTIGWLGAGYVATRTAGKLAGAYLGGRVSGSPEAVNRYLGLAMLPHAGVAIGLALLAAERFPELGKEVLPVTVVATVLFELVGPLLTRLALMRAGETQA